MYNVTRVPEIVVTGRQALAKLSSLPIDYDVVDGSSSVPFIRIAFKVAMRPGINCALPIVAGTKGKSECR